MSGRGGGGGVKRGDSEREKKEIQTDRQTETDMTEWLFSLTQRDTHIFKRLA